jgi:GrpB-like predicted nucleotidyltransferase (UPF0157 family)
VKFFRFDEEVSIPISDYGSRFSIGPLIADKSQVRTQIMHLRPGGSIGRHPTTVRQLFAVVAGTGEVSGTDGIKRPIKCGQAVVWEVGEEHDAVTEDGMTAVCVEGDFEVLAFCVTQTIEVLDYDPQWVNWFETIRDRVLPAIAGVATRIDHVGSTAVPGLCAKPIIDMDIVVDAPEKVPLVIKGLRSIGYSWRGDYGVAGREVFTPPNDDRPRHHLYLVVENNKAHVDHWLLRDLLKEDPGARDEYARLKRRNAELADGDIDVYVAAKAGFVAGLLARARSERGLPPVDYWEPED